LFRWNNPIHNAVLTFSNSALARRRDVAAQLKLIQEGKDKDSMDRQKALEAALAQIDRAFGKGSAMRLGAKETMQVEAVSTGSLGLDIALGIGGLPRGRIIEIYGPESSGKTTLALHAIAEAQKGGGRRLLSMPNTRSIRSMPRNWASISTI
jgi:predicted ATP-dependent serine protease